MSDVILTCTYGGRKGLSLCPQAFSPLHVNNFFGIESHEDSPIEGMPGITMSKPGPLQVGQLACQFAGGVAGSLA